MVGGCLARLVRAALTALKKGNFMAKPYAPSGDEMDSTYSGAPDAAPDTAAAGEKQSVDEQNAMSSTALVPNKILSPEGEPLKEGDEIVVRVVKNHGEESEIEYAPKKGGDEEGPTEDETTPGNEEAEIASLDQKGY